MQRSVCPIFNFTLQSFDWSSKNNTDRTLDVVFSRFRGFPFTIIEAEPQRSYAHSAQNYKTDRELVLRHMRLTPLGSCLRGIVNENPLNIERTTFRVLSMLLLIYV